MATEVKHLLSQVITINNKYDQIAEATGDYYNIFEILRIETNEVRHSAFIADLLDVKGYHSQGDKFLRMFISILKKLIKLPQDFPEFNYSVVKTEIEKIIGFTTDDEGGRIDILISDYTTAIVIENKIYAADQPNQLTRYHNYAKRYKNHKILYLNLNGNTPKNQEGVPYEIITYREVILPWLEECINECVSKPKIRESIAQYIQTIKYLCGMSTNNEKSIEIGKLIASSEDYIRAAQDILDSINYAKANLQFVFWKNMQIKLSTLTNDIVGFDVTFEKVNDFYVNKPDYGIYLPLAEVNNKYAIILWVGLDEDKIPFHSYLLNDLKTGKGVQKNEMLERNDEAALIQKMLYELIPSNEQWYWKYLEPKTNLVDLSIGQYNKLKSPELVEEYFIQIERMLKRFEEKINSIFPGSLNPNLRLPHIVNA